MNEMQVAVAVAGLAVALVAFTAALLCLRAIWRNRRAWSRSATRTRDKH